MCGRTVLVAMGGQVVKAAGVTSVDRSLGVVADSEGCGLSSVEAGELGGCEIDVSGGMGGRGCSGRVA